MSLETTRRNELEENMDKKIFLIKRAVELDNEEKILQSLQKPEKQLKTFRDIINKKIKNNEHAKATEETHKTFKQPSRLKSFACINTDMDINNNKIENINRDKENIIKH